MKTPNPKPLVEHDPQLQYEAQKLGRLGLVFGTRENAAIYITGGIIILVLTLLGTLMFFDETLRSDLATAIGAIGIAAMGYIGGLIKK
ncbi:MAG: hypothetical protein H8E39_09170 [Alphaproteobacteria bacterium]|nr:hypothetical protein [Alphaproteobacteria bacterium]